MRTIECFLNEKLTVKSLNQAIQDMPTIEHINLNSKDLLQVNE